MRAMREIWEIERELTGFSVDDRLFGLDEIHRACLHLAASLDLYASRSAVEANFQARVILIDKAKEVWTEALRMAQERPIA